MLEWVDPEGAVVTRVVIGVSGVLAVSWFA